MVSINQAAHRYVSLVGFLNELDTEYADVLAFEARQEEYRIKLAYRKAEVEKARQAMVAIAASEG